MTLKPVHKGIPLSNMQDGTLKQQRVTGKIIQKRRGAVVFLGIVFLLIALVLGGMSGAVMYNETIGVYDIVLSEAEIFGNSDSSTKARVQKVKSLAHIEALIAFASLITSGVLLSLKGSFCSECGSKIGTETAKLCGSCGARFKLN